MNRPLYDAFSKTAETLFTQTGIRPEITVTGPEKEIDTIFGVLYDELCRDMNALVEMKPKPGLCMHLGTGRLSKLETPHGTFLFKYEEKRKDEIDIWADEIAHKIIHFGE